MEDDKMRKTLREQIDNYHAYNQEYGHDTLMANVAHQIAMDDLEGWDLCGLVPMSVWITMSDAQQQTIRDYGNFSLRLIMILVGFLTLGGVAFTVAWGWGGFIGSASGSAFLLITYSAYMRDSRQGWSPMIAPGTTSALKHSARLYTEASAQLERSKARGALTAAEGAQSEGRLTMAGEQGQLEVCDEMAVE